MDRAFVLELQQELIAAGYEDVELRYLSESGKNATINLTYRGVLRRIGLFLDGDAVTYYDGDVNSRGLLLQITSVKDLAKQIFDRDAGTKPLPDFRKFTGLND